ncbi:MAG: NADH ubiquinone oxidoreductase 20 kDa subunit, partial [Caulobacteraceae bacterium]
MSAGAFNILWLQAGSCGGCTMSMLEHGSGGWFRELDTLGVNLLWHPSVSEETGTEARVVLERVEAGETPLHALCIEGAILCGPDGTGFFNRLAGTGRAMLDWARVLAAKADYCVAIGSCATFGGVPAADPDPTDAVGLQYRKAVAGGALGADYRSRRGLPVINVAGCAPHPGWIMETLAALALDVLTADDLDALGRPKFYVDHLAHHGCSRNEFYEFKA